MRNCFARSVLFLSRHVLLLVPVDAQAVLLKDVLEIFVTQQESNAKTHTKLPPRAIFEADFLAYGQSSTAY